jgi:hypothetical protein
MADIHYKESGKRMARNEAGMRQYYRDKIRMEMDILKTCIHQWCL